jgi:hypothetical protein
VRRVYVVLASWLWVACSLTSSGDDGDDGTCPAYCSSVCDALGQCQVTVGATCVSDCQSGIGTKACKSMRPPSQYSCDEVQGIYDCASYCTAFCRRAPTCGAFDQNRCLEGCALQTPSVCNPASVDARTCDQLKPEARDYQDAADAHAEGTGFGVIATPQEYGLCADASECDPTQACLLATNTCGPCATNADCAQSPPLTYACQAGKCGMVDCLTSADCGSSGVCDTSKYACVQCLTDADCAGSLLGKYAPRCGVQNLCVVCSTDADCPNSPQATCAGGFCQ